MPQITIDSQAIAQPIQISTCVDCPHYQSRQDGTNKGWCNLFNVFARESHVTTQDCINTIADEQAVAQQELDEYIEVQAESIAPEQPVVAATTPDAVEVDSDFDPDFGIMYRVWQSYRLLGTFYHAWGDGKWIAQPVGSDFRPRLNTPEQAQSVIVAMSISSQLVAA